MRPISPNVGWEEVHSEDPDGARMSGVVAIQPYDDLRISTLTRWRLTADERERVAKGEDLFVICITDRVTPHGLSVGSPVEPVPEPPLFQP